MLRNYLRLLNVVLLASCLLPFFAIVTSQNNLPVAEESQISLMVTVGGVGVLVALILYGILSALQGRLETLSEQQAHFLDGIKARKLDLAILVAAALSLFFELTMIRWQATVFEVLSFYKNIGLIACFGGLGIGYALARSFHIPLAIVTPLLAWQVGLCSAMRYFLPRQLDSLSRNPFKEQMTMGMSDMTTWGQHLAVAWMLLVVFLMNVLLFLPVGQLCGRLMDRAPKLRSYGLNLLGSLVGTTLMFLVSAFWWPPAYWFGICLVGLLIFQWRPAPALATTAVAAVVIVGTLLAPARGGDRMYSPYQVLEFGRDDNGQMKILAAGLYFQAIFDFTDEGMVANDSPVHRLVKAYYELPYRIRGKDPGDVVVVGAGSGNDVAGALRSNVRSVTAVEIDPAIVEIGKGVHPEQPYSDERTRVMVNDARTFLRTTDQKFDMIVYGLLDSHTVLSHASNVRLDSFVYTVEALREARARLKEGGMLSLSFCAQSLPLAKKFYLMMTEAFDGRPPVCIHATYNDATLFIQAEGEHVRVPPELLTEHGFVDITPHLANPQIVAEVSVDDWPFLYMPRRVYPTSYLIMVLSIFAVSLLLIGMFFPDRPRGADAPFFLLGMGFMLIETKGITELGLVFGNTWQVIGIVIMSILVCCFVANLLVAFLRIEDLKPWYLLLLISLLAGLMVKMQGSFAPTTGGKLLATATMAMPILFAGVVFSSLLAKGEEISRAMAANLFGAICGGLLEYNSMYFGFQFLDWLALGIYSLAFVSSLLALPAPATAAVRTRVAASTRMGNRAGG